MIKGRRSHSLVAVALALALVASAGLAIAAAGPQLDWWVVAGGGGVSSGGDFQVEGTAGQVAAGALRAAARFS
jgi:hypothetical protein